MKIEQLQREAWEHAESKGFHDVARSIGDECALLHSEISEAYEEIRAGRKPNEIYYRADGKPEGFPAELADLMIRIGDTAHAHNIDLTPVIIAKMAYNKTRPHMHGGKTI